MWRAAEVSEDASITRLCLALNAEDPGPEPVSAKGVLRTLRALCEDPRRGRALVLELSGQVCGYALIITFWSNELGGEALAVDELYVLQEHRGRGHATGLIEDLAARAHPWSSNAVALTLEVSPENVRALNLYQRLGFKGRNLSLRRRLSA